MADELSGVSSVSDSNDPQVANNTLIVVSPMQSFDGSFSTDKVHAGATTSKDQLY
jgi:hypothetical protein